MAGAPAGSPHVALLRDVARSLAASRTLDEVVHAAVEAVVLHLEVPGSRVRLRHGEDLVPVAHAGTVGPAGSAASYPLVVEGELLGVLELHPGWVLDGPSEEALATVADALALGVRRMAAEEELRQEGSIVEVLYEVSQAIAGSLELEVIVQMVTDSATKLVGAEFGAFFYNVVDEQGESFTLWTIAGVEREAFSSFPLPRNTAIFAPTFHGTGVVRLDDVTSDRRYGREAPYHGMPRGHLPVRSYLAVPVVLGSGEVLGGLFFGHADVGVFDARAERIAVGIAQQAAAAVDSARAYENEHRVALRLQQVLLPAVPAAIPGASVAVRYVPASRTSQVGGDWYDVTQLPDGTTAITIGDVVGHDLHAAVAMGQLRGAVRLHAFEGHEPCVVLDKVDAFMDAAGIEDLATAIHGRFDPSSGALDLCRAGHPPPLIRRADGALEWPDLDELGGAILGLGVPAGARTMARFHLGPGDTVVLFTDGLVERRGESIDHGLRRLADVVGASTVGTVDELCDEVLAALGANDLSDDVALVVLRIDPVVEAVAA